MKVTLKRCPFCNGHNLAMHRSEIVSSIQCNDCGAMGPFDNGDFGATIMWNEGADNPSALVRQILMGNNRNDEKEIEV